MLLVSHISKSFNDLKAVSDVSFTVNPGEVLAVLGPSGCGKSTLLALIAGLIAPDEGDVSWDGGSITGTPTHQRSFGLMFQDYALFPHLNVGENVGFGVSNAGAMHVSPLLDRLGLKGFEKRDAQTLSGGEQQRVALARALAPRPRLLMLDEPLGALDRSLREQLTRELREILNEFKQTAIYVTHDQQEAFGIADHIAIMQSGRFVQIGTPEEVYRNPQNNFVREFLGNAKLIEGTVRGKKIESEIGDFEVGSLQLDAGEEVVMLIRPEGIRKKGK